ncbi:unnamed protein product, partial [Prorocentrum cordatum]
DGRREKLPRAVAWGHLWRLEQLLEALGAEVAEAPGAWPLGRGAGLRELEARLAALGAEGAAEPPGARLLRDEACYFALLRAVKVLAASPWDEADDQDSAYVVDAKAESFGG